MAKFTNFVIAKLNALCTLDVVIRFHLNDLTFQQLTKRIEQHLTALYPVAESRSIALRLIEHCSGYDRAELLMMSGDIAASHVITCAQSGLEQLMTGRPLQQLTGCQEFYRRPFLVNEDVLIPRPETEELTSYIIQELQYLKRNFRILDIGTGTGCIAITLALEIPQSHVFAVDISEKALDVAKRNARLLGAEVSFQQWDALNPTGNLPFKSLMSDKARPRYGKDRKSGTPLHPGRGFDIIVSNPPYIMPSEMQSMPKNVISFEPHTALFAPEEDPELFFRAISRFSAAGALNKGGRLFFEINETRAETTEAVIRSEGFMNVRVLNDMQGKPRFILARAMSSG